MVLDHIFLTFLVLIGAVNTAKHITKEDKDSQKPEEQRLDPLNEISIGGTTTTPTEKKRSNMVEEEEKENGMTWMMAPLTIRAQL
mmetsp:Transcript_34858/g.49473  ORF Transcript_34858/g.49473 Transcript_34858/m.49473 type:complete len:85 (+) Transcript_34858:180-434(+)